VSTPNYYMGVVSDPRALSYGRVAASFRVEMAGEFEDIVIDAKSSNVNSHALNSLVEFLTVLEESGAAGDEVCSLKTNSKYVVDGIYEWISKWERNGWVTSSGAAVKNKDTWLAARDKIRRLGVILEFDINDLGVMDLVSRSRMRIEFPEGSSPKTEKASTPKTIPARIVSNTAPLLEGQGMW
jgi:ribonuclease HI